MCDQTSKHDLPQNGMVASHTTPALSPVTQKTTKHDPIVKRFPNHHHQTERILITNPLTTRVTNLHVAVNPSTEKKLP